MFIGLWLSFSGFLVAKYMSLNDEQCKITPILIDLNPSELNYYSFMISLDKLNRSCNTVTKISGRNHALNEAENVSLNVFSLIARINE